MDFRKKKLEFHDRSISYEDPTFIIAEIGINHNGQMEIAKKLIDEAINCGADAVKFQSFKTEILLSMPSPKLPEKERKAKEGLIEAIKKLELTEDDHYEIKEYCDNKSIIFFSTAGDLESFKLLTKLKIPLIKIASNDINNYPLLENIAKSKIPTIISTGMSYLSEVDEALRIFEEKNHSNLAILHCISNYPPATKDLNLNNIITLYNCFQYPIGFSDHTMDLHFSIAAVAMGACIIERHFTLDHNMEGFDHKSSLNIQQFKDLVQMIRDIEIAKGSFNKAPVKAELVSINNMRRSIVAKNNIPANTKITREMIELKRPGTGLSARYIEFIIGRKTKNRIYKDGLILLSDLD